MLDPAALRQQTPKENKAWYVDPVALPESDAERAQKTRREIAELIRSDRFELPPMPAVAQEVFAAAGSPNVSVRELARIAHRDPFIAGRVLKVANSAAYGFLSPAGTLKDAIVRIGMQEFRNIILVLGMKGEVFRSRDFQTIAERTWTHSLATAIACGIIAKATRRVEGHRAFLAGLMHDVGVSVVVKAAVEHLRARPTEKDYLHGSLTTIAADLHQEVGALVARRWRLDDGLVDAIAHHHRPSEAEVEPTLAMHVALADSAAHHIGADCVEPPRIPFGPKPFRAIGLDWGMDETFENALREKVAEYHLAVG